MVKLSDKLQQAGATEESTSSAQRTRKPARKPRQEGGQAARPAPARTPRRPGRRAVQGQGVVEQVRHQPTLDRGEEDRPRRRPQGAGAEGLQGRRRGGGPRGRGHVPGRPPAAAGGPEDLGRRAARVRLPDAVGHPRLRRAGRRCWPTRTSPRSCATTTTRSGSSVTASSRVPTSRSRVARTTATSSRRSSRPSAAASTSPPRWSTPDCPTGPASTPSSRRWPCTGRA